MEPAVTDTEQARYALAIHAVTTVSEQVFDLVSRIICTYLAAKFFMDVIFMSALDHRNRIASFLEGNAVTTAITVLILINAVTLGMETDADIVSEFGGILTWLDRAILVIFSVEIVLKLYVYRLGFFRSGWNIFDLSIVGIAWLPTSGALTVLRTLRILRVLRLISVVPQMRRVVSAIGYSIPGMMSVVGVLGLIFYVAAVLATKLFGTYPDPDMQKWFGTISASAYTLFQIMTLESWSMGVVRPTMDLFPWAWAFFLPFIIITSFAVLNFFIGIIVDSMQTAQKLEAEALGVDDDAPLTQRDLRKLDAKLDKIADELASIKQAREGEDLKH
jgi:voltage-gated sodium channel